MYMLSFTLSSRATTELFDLLRMNQCFQRLGLDQVSQDTTVHSIIKGYCWSLPSMSSCPICWFGSHLWSFTAISCFNQSWSTGQKQLAAIDSWGVTTGPVVCFRGWLLNMHRLNHRTTYGTTITIKSKCWGYSKSSGAPKLPLLSNGCWRMD